MAARSLMFQGTGSDVGKSLVVAGLCRAFANSGLSVRPFKPQNMSNNAAVTVENGEIGRAQALQARAARVPPSVHMNPVLLKPQGGASQVVVQGRVRGVTSARDYQALKPDLMPAVMESFERLRGEADLVLVEGAGSASETNLRANDIANMGFARRAGVPVVLIGDIDRGGVIASLAGTKLVVDPADAALIRGFIVNRFRGDPSLFDAGMAEIARVTGWQSFGLLPHFDDASRLPAEDALALSGKLVPKNGGGPVRVVVPVLPHISNFDDLDPLEAEPDVKLIRVKPGKVIPGDASLVLLPGSKATIEDLAALREAGFDVDIAAHVRRGGFVLGLCGGYQMLGHTIGDPQGMEGAPGKVAGLGLLDVDTVLTGNKRLEQVHGKTTDGINFGGYEMHIGETRGPDALHPFAILADGRSDGARSPSGRVAGTYMHGFFSDDAQRSAWIERLGGAPSGHDYETGIDETLDRLAEHMAAHLDLDGLLSHAA
ncbi:MAG: cobyric acid synthase [Rhizobiaceae bacterium]